MGPCFIDFSFEGPMTPFQFGKMGFYGHVLKFSSVRLVPDKAIIHPKPRIPKQDFMLQSSNLRFDYRANPLLDGKENQPRLEPEAAKLDNNGRYWLWGINRW